MTKKFTGILYKLLLFLCPLFILCGCGNTPDKPSAVSGSSLLFLQKILSAPAFAVSAQETFRNILSADLPVPEKASSGSYYSSMKDRPFIPPEISEQQFLCELSMFPGTLALRLLPTEDYPGYHMEVMRGEERLGSLSGYIPDEVSDKVFRGISDMGCYDVNYDNNTDIIFIEVWGDTSIAVVYLGDMSESFGFATFSHDIALSPGNGLPAEFEMTAANVYLFLTKGKDNGGLNEVSWGKSNIKSVSEEMSHGFYFNFSISFGVFGDGILFSHDVGFETSLSYSNGSGVSTTTTSSEGCTGVVNDIDGPDLASNGIPANVYTQYTFDWTLGQWFRHLYGDENNKTIFIGYNLTNLSAPSPAVVDLEAELLDEDEIRLTWSQPDKTPGWPDAEGYYLYQVENGEYNRISNLIPVGTTSYDISGLKTNTEYEYVLTTVCKVDGKDKESAWSNSATITTAKRDYKVNYKIDNEKAADISVRHLGNVNIKSGDEINENDIIKIRVSPKNRHFELVSLTLDNGGEETVFRPDLNGNIECAFALGGEANIFVSTRKTFDSAEVIFVGEYKNGEDLLGTVTAKVGETDLPAPGGTVTGDVTFTAVPQNGYTLKSWKITDAENNTDIVNAAGSNTYTLTLGSTRYTVEAEFERVSETDRPVKLTYSVASGNETGMAATKQTYQSGTAVPVGTKINFIAQAAEGYRVQKLVITKNGIPDTVITDNRLYDMYEYELTVDTQTDIKVYFTEIEKYTVTVDMPNKNAEVGK